VHEQRGHAARVDDDALGQEARAGRAREALAQQEIRLPCITATGTPASAIPRSDATTSRVNGSSACSSPIHSSNRSPST
jgi:hypothetical protein